jgi:hypothetical protein
MKGKLTIWSHRVCRRVLFLILICCRCYVDVFFPLSLWRLLPEFSFFSCSIMCLYVLSCDIRYDFRIKSMFSSSLPPVICRRAHVLFTCCAINSLIFHTLPFCSSAAYYSFHVICGCHFKQGIRCILVGFCTFESNKCVFNVNKMSTTTVVEIIIDTRTLKIDTH